ncbi:hypothetical protein SUNI508_09970 [Seiridium unicorne]|uniref:Antifreeze protein n=1 Tax=Seiridium unicorne TaxID=138068 RepID=A0ABR2UNM0_9PEZI
MWHRETLDRRCRTPALRRISLLRSEQRSCPVLLLIQISFGYGDLNLYRAHLYCLDYGSYGITDYDCHHRYSDKRTTEAAPSSASSKKHCSSIYPSTIQSSTTAASSSATSSQYPSYSHKSQLSSLLSQASSIIGQVCTCLETPQTSVTSSTPLATSIVTATSTSSATASETVTTTPVVTSIIQTTDVVVVTDLTSTTSTSTSTTTITSTSTVTATTFYTYPTCQPRSEYSSPGAGGCSSNCYCDASVSGYSVCDTAYQCGQNCDSDSDCPGGQFCLSGGYFTSCTNGRTCASSTSCSSTYSAAKLMFERAMGMPEVGAEPMGKRDSETESVAPVRVGLFAPFP